MCNFNNTTGRFPGNKKSDTMKPEDIYNGLEYTTKEINRTFKIKVNGLFNGKKINTLVGVSGLIKLVGVEMANKLLRRAFRCVKDAEHCKLRRGFENILLLLLIRPGGFPEPNKFQIWKQRKEHRRRTLPRLQPS